MKKYKDFDEFFETMNKDKETKIRLYEKDYFLPTEIPATVMLELHSQMQAGNETLTEAKQISMAIQMLGESNVKEWCEKGMTMNQLAEIMKWSMSSGDAPTESKKKMKA